MSPRQKTLELTKYVINNCRNCGSINQLKLQKLLYYIQAWTLVFTGKRIIQEKFQAWVHGPVLRSVYDRYKSQGDMYTPLKANGYDLEWTTEEQFEIINDVLNIYGKKSDYKLEAMTHSETPWIKARIEVHPAHRSTNPIDEKLMRKYYRKILNES